MNKFFFILSFIIVNVFTFNEVSCQINVSVQFQDRQSLSPINGVEIFSGGLDQIQKSAENGIAVLGFKNAGEYALNIFHESFEFQTLLLNVHQDTSITILMDPLSYELSSIEITAQRQSLFGMAKLPDVEDTYIYAGKKTEMIVMNTVKGDLGNNNSRQVYAQVAGLNIYENNDGGLQLNIGGRGLDPNRTSNFNTRQNGYDISADVLGYPESYYTPPTEAIKEIRILRGASSLQYGTQFGGLIDFRLNEISTDEKWRISGNHTIGSFNSLTSFHSAGLNHKAWSLNTYFKHQRGDGFRANSEYKGNHFFISGAYKPNEDFSIRLEYTAYRYLSMQAGGLTDEMFLNNPVQSTRERNWIEVDWNLFNLKMAKNLPSNSRLSFQVFGLIAERNTVGYRGNPTRLNENPITSIDEQQADGSYLLPRDLILGSFKNAGMEFRFLKPFTLKKRKANLLIGTKIYNALNTAQQGSGTRDIDADFSSTIDLFPTYPNQSEFEFPNFNAAVFTEAIFPLTDQTSITPGIRVEHILTKANGEYLQLVFDNAGNAIDSQSFSEEREVPRTFLLAGVGMSHTFEKGHKVIFNISQNYRSITFSDIRVVSPSFVVDPDITDEKGFTADLGINGKLGQSFSYDLNSFSVLYNDRIGIILDSRANRVRTNIGNALIYGIESLTEWNLTKMLDSKNNKWKASCFLNMAYTSSQYLESEENNVEGKKVEFIPAWNIKTGFTIGYNRLTTNVQWTFLSDQFTDAQNSLAVIGDFREGIIGPIPSYNVLDLHFKYQLKRIRITGGVNNLLDRSYFTQRATGYPGPGIIPSQGRNFYLGVGYGFFM